MKLSNFNITCQIDADGRPYFGFTIEGKHGFEARKYFPLTDETDFRVNLSVLRDLKHALHSRLDEDALRFAASCSTEQIIAIFAALDGDDQCAPLTIECAHCGSVWVIARPVIIRQFCYDCHHNIEPQKLVCG